MRGVISNVTKILYSKTGSQNGLFQAPPSHTHIRSNQLDLYFFVEYVKHLYDIENH